MIEPLRAAVRPRVRLQPSGEAVLLEDAVAEQLATGYARSLLLCGRAGGGKTTALQHLAHHFADEQELFLIDSFQPRGSPSDQSSGLILIRHGESPGDVFIKYELVGWGRDEWIEYLLALHHDRCTSVMGRLQADGDCGELLENPNLWRLVLDELAVDEQLKTVKAAMQRVIAKHFADEQVRRAVKWRCFRNMLPAAAQHIMEPTSVSRLLSAEQERLLRKPYIQLLLGSEAAAWSLAHSDLAEILRDPWPGRLVDAAASHVAASEPIQERLERLLVPKHLAVHPLAVSLLHVSGSGWQPEPPRLTGIREGRLNLSGAFLEEARWLNVDLTRCDLIRTLFARAELFGANLEGAIAIHADFAAADLRQANLSRLIAHEANFSGANLAATRGRGVELKKANLSRADLTEANLTNSTFREANLSEAILRRARLVATNFEEAVIDGADFTDADLELAILSELDLTVANFDGARFTKAYLDRCHLEGMELPGAVFIGAELMNALLTGSIMPNANFSRANLQGAGLAEIDWEFANLRDTDLRNVSFHMGSTRSGLVGSNIPMLGSRTGFYTDDYNEQDFKSPEEIRKANLRGADLRGAIIDHTDFYLVDLRDALYDSNQEKHFRRCGAILETRGE